MNRPLPILLSVLLTFALAFPAFPRQQESPAWEEAALSVVQRFENGGDPWTGVTPDFDRQGLSCGILQWNIGQNSLQPLVQKAGQETVLKYMPTYGADFWKACTASHDDGLAIVRSWQNITETSVNGVPRRKVAWKSDDVVRELKALLGSKEMKAIQLDRAGAVYREGLAAARTWARDATGHGDTEPDLKMITVFLDAQVFNGGMKGLTYASLAEFRADPETYLRTRKVNAEFLETERKSGFFDTYRAKPNDAALLTLICDWLAAAHEPTYQVKEAHNNANLWRTRSWSPPNFDLLAISFLRAIISHGDSDKFQPNVLGRRGAIIANDGWVNGERMNFPQIEAATVH